MSLWQRLGIEKNLLCFRVSCFVCASVKLEICPLFNQSVYIVCRMSRLCSFTDMVSFIAQATLQMLFC